MPHIEEGGVAPHAAIARRMLGFVVDVDGDWIAQLECGHRRHIRHRPPLSNFPWITDEAARAGKIGESIECPRCARLEVPEDAVAYRTTDEFSEETLPAGLRRDHSTRAGVWGRVEVLAGRLRLVMPALAIDRVLTAGESAILPPELTHHVDPVGAARVRVVFLRVPA